MKALLIFLSVILFTQLLPGQTSHEFSTYLKLDPWQMNHGKVAQTRKQSQTPWKITAIAISTTVVESIGDALYDIGKADGNQNQMMIGKTLQGASLGGHYFYIPTIKDSEVSWLWVPLIEILWRIALFDLVQNLTRGLPIGYIGNTSYWDRGMQSFSPPAGMRIFADCVIATFAISLTFNKY